MIGNHTAHTEYAHMGIKAREKIAQAVVKYLLANGFRATKDPDIFLIPEQISEMGHGNFNPNIAIESITKPYAPDAAGKNKSKPAADIPEFCNDDVASRQAEHILGIMLPDKEHFEEALDDVKNYLRGDEYKDHAIWMVWRLLRQYSKAGILDEKMVVLRREEVLDRIRDILLSERFWQGYLDVLNNKRAADVHVIDIENVFRPDKTFSSPVRDEVLEHAPAREGEFFKVPKVVDR